MISSSKTTIIVDVIVDFDPESSKFHVIRSSSSLSWVEETRIETWFILWFIKMKDVVYIVMMPNINNKVISQDWFAFGKREWIRELESKGLKTILTVVPLLKEKWQASLVKRKFALISFLKGEACMLEVTSRPFREPSLRYLARRMAPHLLLMMLRMYQTNLTLKAELKKMMPWPFWSLLLQLPFQSIRW